ncbi:MAG: caspase family protein [Sphingomonadales bacterium]|nr:caspase family protein [Sphingomonadales bacterium]
MRLACLVVAFLALAGSALAEPRVALVIGNSNYGGDLGQLPNPANDARLMAKTLQGIGFTVIEAENADQAKMKRVIQDFGAKLAGAGDGATGLFFYAGHGLQVAGTNYLIPVNAKIAREPDVDIEAVPVDLIMKQMAFAESAVNIVILDACRNNPLSRGFRAVSRGLADPTVRPMGSFIAYSTAPGDVAEDGKGTNSPYTTALAAAITKPGASINDVFQDVRGKVLAATDKKQVPWDSSSLTAPFYFVPGVADAPSASNAVDPKAIELAFWDAIKDSKAAEDYQAYLEKYPDGDFAPLAQVRARQASQSTTRVIPQGDAPVSAGSATPDPQSFEQAFWNTVHEGDTVEEYQAYLKQYPKGAFAEAAQQRLAVLGQDSKATPAAVVPAPKPLPAIVATSAKLYARDKARLRVAPETGAAIVTQLAAGTPLAATGRSDDNAWWRVTLSDGRSGFIAAAVVDTQPPPPAAPPPQPAAKAPEPAAPEPEATVPAGQERDICLKGQDRPAAARAVACRRLLAAGIADATDRYNADLFLGDALSNLGKPDEALQAYQAALAIDADFFGAYYDIGLVHLNQGRFADARAAFDKAVARKSDEAASFYGRGTALSNLGDFDAARRDLEQAIALKSDDPTYYEQLEAVHLALGDVDAAVSDLERAATADSDYWGTTAMMTNYLGSRFDLAIAYPSQRSPRASPPSASGTGPCR